MLLLFLFPIASSEIFRQKDIADPNRLEVSFLEPLKTSTYDFFDITVSLKNTKGAQLQSGSAAIKWESPHGFEPLNTENFSLQIDNSTHRYRIPIGQNIRWTQSDLSSFLVEVRDIEGVKTTISEISLKRRVLPGIDIYLNKWAADFLNLQKIDPFYIPSYVLIIFFMIAGFTYIKIFRPAIRFAIFAFILLLAVLILFSFIFLRSQMITIKSHYVSQKDTLRDQGLGNTYSGFLDFRQFLSWAGKNIGPSENIIFLVRGEPVYIMSESVYSLYPRKLKFVNISRSYSEILEDIEESSSHRYIIAMSADDFMLIRNIKGIRIVDRYRQDSGFVLTIEN